MKALTQHGLTITAFGVATVIGGIALFTLGVFRSGK
tara:strand:+ start:2644 stop:2751 length:108 start_codon:yes stop_codon:yes gene_type:complete